MKKKILLSFMFVCISIFAFLTFNVSAEKYDNYLSYIVLNGEVKITGCDTSATTIEIPATINGKPVTSIGDFAFYDCRSLTNITIPNGVTSIDNYAFQYCISLTSITIPNSVTSIGERAFHSCQSLTSISIPNGITNINDFTFYDCSSLKTVTIPNSITNIGNYAFKYCISLTSITIPNSVISIGERAFCNCKNLSSVIIPNSVTNIESEAFRYCHNLTNVTIPDSVTNIGNCAFSDCDKLTGITVDANNNNYYSENGILYNADKTELIMFPKGKTDKKFVIPNGVISIDRLAFGNCSLTSITISDSVTNIGDYAFYSCRSLTSITIPDSVTSIGTNTFNACINLTSITIPSSITNINKSAFSNCIQLTTVKISNGVTSIGASAFEICPKLTTVTIPNSISNIDKSAFNACDSLKNIYYNGTEEQWNKINIDDKNNDSLKNATKIYFAYINLLDKDGNEISSKTQKMGETVDTSAITIPDGYALNLYKDKELTQEYLPDTPICENLTLYADFIEINKLKISGVQKADIGQKDILQSVTFATDKTAKYLVCTVKYPKDLQLKEISAKDFYVDEDMRETLDGYTYSYLTCTYKENGNIPLNKTLNPFGLIFDISENAKANTVLKIEILEDAVLSGDDTFTFDTIINNEITTNPILIQEMSIIGADEIDKAATYTVLFNPENATNKAVKWSVDDETVADVSESGTLTPIKSGTVVLKAASTDGSEVYAEKTVNVKVYAEISSITANTGVWNTEFIPETKEYIIYVSKNTTSIRLTAKHSGTLKSSDNKIFVNNVAKPISIKDDETNITLTYSCTGYTDSVYTLKILKFEGTKTAVSDDGKSFTIKPVNIAKGKTVIMALYDGDELAETQNTVYNGTDISFKTDKAYTNAKVMVWESLENIKPICDDEIVK